MPRLWISPTTMGFGLATMVDVKTCDGKSTFPMSINAIEGNTVEIDEPLEVRDDQVLIQLPSKPVAGEQQVWVPKDQIIAELAPAA